MQSLTDLNSAFTIYYLSEHALTVTFGHEISEGMLAQVTRFNEAILRHPFPGFRTTVPAYSTISLFYDPLQVSKSELPGIGCFEKVSNYLYTLPHYPVNQLGNTNKAINIPTCYGGLYGEDIAEVARINKLTVAQVVQLHSSAVYKVYMIGFVPGFAYLGGMAAQLATPRKATPRKAIPAGAVGIAGEQTGIYPLETPGGWQLIGRTPLKLFDANRDQPALLKAGDEVTFTPITPIQFEEYCY